MFPPLLPSPMVTTTALEEVRREIAPGAELRLKEACRVTPMGFEAPVLLCAAASVLFKEPGGTQNAPKGLCEALEI